MKWVISFFCLLSILLPQCLIQGSLPQKGLPNFLVVYIYLVTCENKQSNICIFYIYIYIYGCICVWECTHMCTLVVLPIASHQQLAWECWGIKPWLNGLVQNNSGYSNFTQASPLSLYIPCYSISQLPRLAGILSLTCLNQNSLCLLHPPIPSSTVSASLVNDNSILPRNTFVPLLLSLYLTLVSSVWSASVSPSSKMGSLDNKVVQLCWTTRSSCSRLHVLKYLSPRRLQSKSCFLCVQVSLLLGS